MPARQLRRRSFGGARCRAALLDHAHGVDGDFVEPERGDGEADLADRVGRGQHRRHDEGDDDGVFAPRPQPLRGHDAGAAEQRQDHRKLEHQAEGEDQRHDEAEIFVHLRQKLDRRLAHAARLLHRKEEGHGERHDQEIDEHRAKREEHRRRREERQESAPLMAIEPGRDEFVDLVGDDG